MASFGKGVLPLEIANKITPMMTAFKFIAAFVAILLLSFIVMTLVSTSPTFSV